MMESNTLEVVQKILQNAQAERSFKSTQVTKDIDVDIDVGNLLALDPNPLDLKRLRYATWAIIEMYNQRNIYSCLNAVYKLSFATIYCHHSLPDSLPDVANPGRTGSATRVDSSNADKMSTRPCFASFVICSWNSWQTLLTLHACQVVPHVDYSLWKEMLTKIAVASFLL